MKSYSLCHQCKQDHHPKILFHIKIFIITVYVSSDYRHYFITKLVFFYNRLISKKRRPLQLTSCVSYIITGLFFNYNSKTSCFSVSYFPHHLIMYSQQQYISIFCIVINWIFPCLLLCTQLHFSPL